MAGTSVEQRLEAIENQFALLTTRICDQETERHPAAWESGVGIFADDPLFEEAMRLGREWRQQQNFLLGNDPDAPA